MRTECKKIVFGIVLILCAATLSVYADWQPGDPYKMHFPQLPDPCGWDVCLMDQALADDFLCTQSGPIKDIHFWISYRWDQPIPIDYWDIYIATDANGVPGTYLWGWDGLSGNLNIIPYGQCPQGWYCPTMGIIQPYDHNMIWQVNLTGITNPYVQQQGQIYWLIIQARSPSQPPGAGVGWKSSINSFGAPAKWWNSSGGGWQPLSVINPPSLAFVITGPPITPEPNVKWYQGPDLSNNGLDVKATKPLILADDFNCNQSTLITDITVWGSWKNDILPPGGPNNVKFTLSIHSDIPADPNTGYYSRPGQTLWSMDLMPSEVYIEAQDINEGWWDPNLYEYISVGDHKCWKYVFHIPEANAFCQQGEPCSPVVYWLDVQADPIDPNKWAKFGWKSSSKHWNDDAVWGMGIEPYPVWYGELRYPPYHPLDYNSIDLAFAIDGNIPCETVKWRQNPDLSPNGVDVMATKPLILADDFECNVSTFITDITIWGSWKNDILPRGGPNDVKFTLSFHSDIPAGPNTYSRPGGVLWYNVLAPSEVSIEAPAINEGWWDPNSNEYIPVSDHICWKYVFHIPEANAFCQQGGPSKMTYWLDVQADPNDPNAKFGWKSSNRHWNDDAVWGRGSEPYTGPWNELRYPPGHPLLDQSIDLAFIIGGNIPCSVLPGKATNPNPANGAINVSLTKILSWTAGAAATSHDVYFGTAFPLPFKVNLPQLTTTYDPGTLVKGTTYYWHIDEKNPCGTTTGDLWSFTTAQKCFKDYNLVDHYEYNTWVAWGEPNCWCCRRHCRGDADCKKTGIAWVASPDLNLLKRCFNKTDTVLKNMTNCICADFDHKKTGVARVSAPDLNILKLYYNRPEAQVPCCDKDQNCTLDCNIPGDKWYFWTN